VASKAIFAKGTSFIETDASIGMTPMGPVVTAEAGKAKEALNQESRKEAKEPEEDKKAKYLIRPCKS
jgi:hypothetical protein